MTVSLHVNHPSAPLGGKLLQTWRLGLTPSLPAGRHSSPAGAQRGAESGLQPCHVPSGSTGAMRARPEGTGHRPALPASALSSPAWLSSPSVFRRGWRRYGGF